MGNTLNMNKYAARIPKTKFGNFFESEPPI